MDGPLVVGKDLQLHPHQHEPVVGQVQKGLQEGGSHPHVLVLCMDEEPHAAHVAHPGAGAHTETGGPDDGAVGQHRHEVVVVRAHGLEAVDVPLDPLGGETHGVFKDAGHPPQDVEALHVLQPGGTDGVFHVSALLSL